jgi:hypothetical protein
MGFGLEKPRNFCWRISKFYDGGRNMLKKTITILEEEALLEIERTVLGVVQV